MLPPPTVTASCKFFCENCIPGARRHIPDESIHLAIDDPPFDIGESRFGAIYNRDSSLTIAGYAESPEDYYRFSAEWLTERWRTLTSHGSAYVVSGWTNSDLLCQAAREVGFHLCRKIIWSFQFGPYTKRKYVSSHYDILFLTKHKSRFKFNTHCRFGPKEKDEVGRSRCYQDRQDVWEIPKEYHPGQRKNQNKLPDALVEKMILYSSDFGDTVSDFFLGNFTTAVVAQRLGRKPIGFELNPRAYRHGLKRFRRLSLPEDEVVLDEVVRGIMRGMNGDSEVRPSIYLSLTPKGRRRAEQLQTRRHC